MGGVAGALVHPRGRGVHRCGRQDQRRDGDQGHAHAIELDRCEAELRPRSRVLPATMTRLPSTRNRLAGSDAAHVKAKRVATAVIAATIKSAAAIVTLPAVLRSADSSSDHRVSATTTAAPTPTISGVDAGQPVTGGGPR